ncbi:MAG TPA: hypothetical protein ENH09_03745 [Bacteroidetes bacterium]|nr:hypothetical protein [Bacteroidota bacterium]
MASGNYRCESVENNPSNKINPKPSQRAKSRYPLPDSSPQGTESGSVNPSFYHGLTPMAALISSAKADSIFHIQLEFPEIFRIFKIPPFPNLPSPQGMVSGNYRCESVENNPSNKINPKPSQRAKSLYHLPDSSPQGTESGSFRV